MLNFKNFVTRLRKNVFEALPQGFTTQLNEVVKPQGTCLALTIRQEGNNMAPNINLNAFYEDYKNGEPIDILVKKIVEVATRPKSMPEALSNIGDYEKIKSLLLPRVLPNGEYVKDKVTTDIVDLKLAYILRLNRETTITITPQMLDAWNTTVEDIDRQAKANASKTYHISTIREKLIEMTGYDPGMIEVPMLVITNELGIFGAAALADTEVLDKVADMLGIDEYVIIPSSVHELLALPPEMAQSDLSIMISEVNSEQVPPEDRLSNIPYCYSRNSKKVAVYA